MRGFRFTATASTGLVIHDLINQIARRGDGLLQYRNVDNADAWGADLEVEYRSKAVRSRGRATPTSTRRTPDPTTP